MYFLDRKRPDPGKNYRAMLPLAPVEGESKPWDQVLDRRRPVPVDLRAGRLDFFADFRAAFRATLGTLTAFFAARLAVLLRFGVALRVGGPGTSAFFASLTFVAREPSVEPIDSATDTRRSLPVDSFFGASSDMTAPSDAPSRGRSRMYDVPNDATASPGFLFGQHAATS